MLPISPVQNKIINFHKIEKHHSTDAAALSAYALHTKRDWSNGSEETSLFFELDSDGVPTGKGFEDFNSHLNQCPPS